jgi:hypothetical protein
LLFKGVLPTSQCFLDQQHHLSAESPHSREWEKQCSSYKRSINVTSKRPLHLVKHGELSYLLKETLPKCQRFHGWGSSSLCKITAYK